MRQVSQGQDVKVREMRRADTFLNLIRDQGELYEAKVKETRELESRMMRQVSSPVRRGAGRKGRKDLARSLPNFEVLRVLFLGTVFSAFLPSKKACWAPKFRHLGVDQQYPSLFCDICDSALPSQTNTFGLHEEFGLLTARRIRNIRSASS